MLIGEHTHRLDPKKRLAIPAKFRKELGNKAVITKGLDQCLTLYSLDEWSKVTAKLSELPMGPGNSRSFSRLMLAGAVEVEFDSLGRVLVPEYLKQYAGIGQKVVVAGLYNRLEIWDEGKWNSYKSSAESSADMIAEKLGELGLY